MEKEEIIEVLKKAIECEASDIFIVAGAPIAYKVNGCLKYRGDHPIMPTDTADFVKMLFELGDNPGYEKFLSCGDSDFSFSIAGSGRFRVNTYLQRHSQAATLRVVSFDLPDPVKMNIPENIMNMANVKKGLVLVTGPAGSGKSTTLACIIDKINQVRSSHIITIEDPIEFLHKHKKSIVSQREIDHDTTNYLNALRASLRQAPEVIFLGEMRDFETIDTAVTAAETGHLVFSTLHTLGAANTIDRIIDVFPSNQQQQIRIQLAMVLYSVVSQQLVPSITGQMIPVFEVMVVNNAIRSQIRDGKTHQIDNTIYSNRQLGMITMDESLLNLFKENKITKETAVTYSTSPEAMEKRLDLFLQQKNK